MSAEQKTIPRASGQANVLYTAYAWPFMKDRRPTETGKVFDVEASFILQAASAERSSTAMFDPKR